MKKSLFAIAAVGAFAGAAQAQSSVTVYGLLDYGYGSAHQRNVSGNTGAITNQSITGIGGNGESTSRLGFRGTEDLGGGDRAFFTIETALNTDTAGSFSTSASGNRQVFLGMSKKGLGQASLGIQYTPIHEAAAATDPGSLNNQNGNVIYDRVGGVGTQPGTGGTNSVSGMSTNTSYTIRSANMLMLKSERMSGVMVKAFVTQNSKDSNTTSQTIDNFGAGGSVDYAWNKLFLTASYQTFKNTTLAGGIFAPGYNGAGITNGVNSGDTQQYYAATYDFGILKAYVQYLDRKVSNTSVANNFVNRKATQIGVRGNVTKTVTAWASGGTGQINAGGNNLVASDFNGWQIGSDYALSKRTNLYAIYGQTATSNARMATAYATNTATTNLNSYNASSYAVGIRHTF
jgi:predicted porin